MRFPVKMDLAGKEKPITTHCTQKRAGYITASRKSGKTSPWRMRIKWSEKKINLERNLFERWPNLKSNDKTSPPFKSGVKRRWRTSPIKVGNDFIANPFFLSKLYLLIIRISIKFYVGYIESFFWKLSAPFLVLGQPTRFIWRQSYKQMKFYMFQQSPPFGNHKGSNVNNSTLGQK